MSDIPGRKVSDALAVNTKVMRELIRSNKELCKRIDSLFRLVEEEQAAELAEQQAQAEETEQGPKYL